MPPVVLIFIALAAVSTALLTSVIFASIQAGGEAYTRRFRGEEAATLADRISFMPTSWVVSLRLVCALAFGFPGFLVGFAANGLAPLTFLFAFGFAVPGLFLPDVLVRRARAARMEKLHEQLVDGLRIVSNGLRANLSLVQSVKLMADETTAPLSAEARLVVREVDLGVPIERGLENMANRNPIPDLKLFVASVNTVHQMGGGLAEICDRTVGTITERFRVSRKMETLTAEGRTQALVLALMPFFLLAVLHFIDKELTQVLFQTFVGALILGLVVILDFIGFMIIWKITRIDF